jgi:ABC-type nitrate/sulfonate/bicarbonate transport system permease component
VATQPTQVPVAPPWWKRLRAEPSFPLRMAIGGIAVAVVLAIWWFLTHGPVVERTISPSKLPSPGEVLDSWSKMEGRGLTDSILTTLWRVFLGVGLAAVVGVILGVLSGASRGVSAALAPIVIFLRSVPMGALVPLTLLLFSTGEKQKVMFIFLAVFPFVFSDALKAVSIVPERYVETAQTLGASNRQIILKVLVPLALPDIITSLRFQVGLALGYVTLAEAIDTETGLGVLLNGSQREGPYEHVYLLLFIIAILAFAIDLTLRTLQRGVFAWRRDL